MSSSCLIIIIIRSLSFSTPFFCLSDPPPHSSMSLYFRLISPRDHENAIEYFQQALVLTPHTSSSHAGLAYSYHCMGQLDQAILAYHNVGLQS